MSGLRGTVVNPDEIYGKSAYEIAVIHGFSGTEEEWLESLKGEKGEYAEADLTYSPESKNAQSGIAVDQALKTITTENGTVVSQNADFAEVAEWADGNPNNEDRTGYFVCANVPVNGIIMRKATSTDDVKGVSILAPAFAGNYTKDKLDSNGNLLPKYSYVAILGFVPVIDNGTCEVGGRCMPDDNGCAIPSSNNMGYQVVNRIDENRVLIIIEPNGDMVQRVKTKINELQNTIDGAVSEVTKVVTDVYGEINSLNDQRFAVYYTDKILQKTPKDQWLTFKQAYYACGYGGVTYGEGTYDNRPKIGDMLICRPNGYIYKVAGIQESSQTICAWFIASGVGDKEYAEKSYVDEKIATAGGGVADYKSIGSINLNDGSIDIDGQYKEILITFSPGLMLGSIELTMQLSNGRSIDAREYFDYSTYLSYFKFINDGGMFNIMCDRDFSYCSANMAQPQVLLGASIKRITIKGYPESQDWGDGPVTTPFETAQVYAR